MSNHGTTLSAGQRANFLAAGVKALGLIADELGAELCKNWTHNGETLQKTFLNALRPPAAPATDSYPVAVPYKGNATIKELLAAGKYDWTNDDITDAHFPQEREGDESMNIELVHLNRNLSTKKALAKLDKQGMRPANAAELLAFGAKYPQMQRRFPIVALGQQWRRRVGYDDVVCLYENGDKRFAYLDWIEYGWYVYHRFAAVRK